MARRSSTTLSRLSHALMPELCAWCGAWLPVPQAPALCGLCLRSLPWNDNACERCGRAQRAGSPCQCSPPPYATAICPLRYEPPVVGWVLRCKRRGGYPEARLLAACLYHAIRDHYDPGALPDVLVPVPLSWQRRLLRGHNQAELIASVLARNLGLPVISNALRRVRHTPIQPGQSVEQRRTNLRNAFSCRALQGRHVALIDDVMTTGATVNAIVPVLMAAGCSAVEVWCATSATAS